MPPQVLDAGSKRAKTYFDSYARVDYLQPYFDLEPSDVRSRLIGSLVPKFAKDQPIPQDLYGPTMLSFTLSAVLLIIMKNAETDRTGYNAEGTVMGTAFGIAFGYWMTVTGVLCVLTFKIFCVCVVTCCSLFRSPTCPSALLYRHPRLPSMCAARCERPGGMLTHHRGRCRYSIGFIFNTTITLAELTTTTVRMRPHGAGARGPVAVLGRGLGPHGLRCGVGRSLIVTPCARARDPMSSAACLHGGVCSDQTPLVALRLHTRLLPRRATGCSRTASSFLARESSR